MISTKRIFGPKGLLAATLPEFEYRPGQEAMAKQVSFALRNDEILLYEAPTGTGKTLAYLIPAVTFGQRVVISTGTKALQEQIVNKDIPLAEKVLGTQVKKAVMKGRQNYLCRARFKIFRAQPVFRFKEEVPLFENLSDWVIHTKTGDREELVDFPDDFSTWSDINSNSNFCTGQKCPSFDRCFFYKMRKRAADSDLIIVNHHLFFADLAVRQNGESAAVIPNYHSLILDEAHQIEDVATQFFGIQVSNYRIEELARDTGSILGSLKINNDVVSMQLKNLRTTSENFFSFFDSKTNDRSRLRQSHLSDELMSAKARLVESLNFLEQLLSNFNPKDGADLIRSLKERSSTIALELDILLDLDDNENVHWYETRRGGVFLYSSPIELKGAVSDLLFSSAASITLCSATMTAGNDFHFFKSRIGLEKEAIESIGEPFFDYQNQGALYVGQNLPEPSSHEFPKEVAQQMKRILLSAQGKAFCLFTSYKNMQAVHEILKSEIPFTVLLQGEGSKSALLDQFRKDEHSVLFATSSFWEGVDVVGSSLSIVLIDKLPFASPGEPIIQARIESIKNNGGNAFFDYQLPQAIISLKQGLGRLIRHRSDKGLLGIFDIRIRKKSYGKRILDSLPGFPVTGDLEKACKYARFLHENGKREYNNTRKGKN